MDTVTESKTRTMNKPEEVFLHLLRCAVNDLPINQDLLEESDPAEREKFWRSLTELGSSHSVLPLIYDRVGKTPAFLELPTEISSYIRRESFAMAALQCRKTQKLMYVLGAIREAGIDCLLIKGMICRSIYPTPDLRFSADEDLVVLPSDLEKLLTLIKGLGMQSAPYEQEDGVVKVGDDSGFVLEIHTLPLFSVENHAFRTINCFLQDIFLRKTETMVDGMPVSTMDPTDHLIFLIGHCLEHLVHSGVGIRQLCDIMLFIRAYGDRIHYPRFKDCLDQSGLLPFVSAITDIIVKWLCPEDGMPQDFLHLFDGVTVDSDPLLDDILKAGVFGKSTMSRLHSANMTLGAVSEGRHSMLHTLFPPASYMKKRYPYVRSHPILLPVAWILRGFTYLKESRKDRSQGVSETLSIGNERIRLLGLYKITAQTSKKNQKAKKTENPSHHSSARIVETVPYLETLCGIIQEGKQVSLTVSGSSMVPFLAGNRDSVLLSLPDGEPKKGDVCLYRRASGQFVLHRLYRVKKDGYYFVGDAQNEIEGPLAREQICAKVIAAVRKGKRITPKNGVWKFYEKLWIRILPMRRPLIRLVGILKR